jgi:hypothetical protein
MDRIITRLPPLARALGLAGVVALAGCVQPASDLTGTATTSISLGQAVVQSAACLAPVTTFSNRPLLRDGKLVVKGDKAVLSGCVINPGPGVYRVLYLEFAFFDGQGRMMGSTTKEDTTYLPPFSAMPATPNSPTGLPRWLQPFTVDGDKDVTRAEILMHVVICPTASPAGCREEHDLAVIDRDFTS